MSASTFSHIVGMVAGVLTIAIPILFWWLLNRFWAHYSRMGYALKFSFWPAIIFSSQLAGPLARELFGIHSQYAMTFFEATQGLAGAEIFLGPIFFAIGYWIGWRRFKDRNASNASG